MKRSLICTIVVVAATAAPAATGQPRLEVVGTLQGNGNVQAAAMTVDRSGNIYAGCAGLDSLKPGG